MTENSFYREQATGDSIKTEIRTHLRSSILPEEHLVIIGTIGNRCGDGEDLPLPKIRIWERQNTLSPIDELRKHIAHHDQIKPFTPFPEKIPQVLGTYDPTQESYWKAVQETIERWKNPSIFDAIKLPHAKPGYHFVLNPNTGQIEERKIRLTMEWRDDEDGYQDGRPRYKIDPNTGDIVQAGRICTAEWRDDRDGWQRKDHYYGLNPETGRIELRPNVRTMDFRLH